MWVACPCTVCPLTRAFVKCVCLAYAECPSARMLHERNRGDVLRVHSAGVSCGVCGDKDVSE